ncbi:unnamed protein product [Calypogeia fissa]
MNTLDGTAGTTSDVTLMRISYSRQCDNKVYLLTSNELSVAEALVKTGLADVGYKYVNNMLKPWSKRFNQRRLGLSLSFWALW